MSDRTRFYILGVLLFVSILLIPIVMQACAPINPGSVTITDGRGQGGGDGSIHLVRIYDKPADVVCWVTNVEYTTSAISCLPRSETGLTLEELGE